MKFIICVKMVQISPNLNFFKASYAPTQFQFLERILMWVGVPTDTVQLDGRTDVRGRSKTGTNQVRDILL